MHPGCLLGVSSSLLYCTLLYSTLLYSTPLYSTLLYSILLYSTLLYSTLLYSILFYSTLLHSFLFYYSLRYPSPLHSTHTLFYSTLSHSILFYFVLLYSLYCTILNPLSGVSHWGHFTFINIRCSHSFLNLSFCVGIQTSYCTRSTSARTRTS